MATDEELIAHINQNPGKESPDDPRQRRVQKEQFAKSEFTAEELKAAFGDKVWVRCVTDRGPWADGKELKLWQEYQISVEDAILLDERRFAVILASKKNMAAKPDNKLTLNKK